MLNKTNLIFAVGVVSLFVGVVYSVVNTTNTMITEQNALLDARVNDQIDSAEYQKLSQASERTYRTRVADALSKIESKFIEAAGIIGRLDDLWDRRPEPEGANYRLVNRTVNVTVIGEDDYLIYINGTVHRIRDLGLNLSENNTATLPVVVVEQNNYYQYYPYIHGNMSEILNLSGDYNYTADLEMITGNLSAGLEDFRTDSIT